jgi:membrane protease YdiL (CAAX protease family)
VITRNWHLAALGVMFSTLTSAAMWQNFRERLPCLFDPDSERLPPAPTLMHAMIAITAMVDGMGVVALPIMLGVGAEGRWAAQVAAYGITALATWVVASNFLEGRGVTPKDIWIWPAGDRSSGPALVDRVRITSLRAGMGVGAALGVGLALLALGYRWCLWHIPSIAEELAETAKYLAEHPQQKWGLFILAVGFAPIAEEYLFRGLLLRALDREWGGWRAVVGSALFFGVYHPPTSWIPVVAVGFVLALLFKATGRLWPGVILHATYNAIVVLTV